MIDETRSNIDLSDLIRKEIHLDSSYNLDDLHSSFEEACQKLIDFRNGKGHKLKADSEEDEEDESIKKN